MKGVKDKQRFGSYKCPVIISFKLFVYGQYINVLYSLVVVICKFLLIFSNETFRAGDTLLPNSFSFEGRRRKFVMFWEAAWAGGIASIYLQNRWETSSPDHGRCYWKNKIQQFNISTSVSDRTWTFNTSDDSGVFELTPCQSS